MDAPAVTYAHVGRWLDGHVASRCTSVIASMLGVTAANRASVVGKLIATAAKRKPGQDGAGRTEWRMGQPLDLGRNFNPRCWTFVDFHAPPPHAAAAAPIDHRAMALFLTTLDQFADEQSLLCRSIACGEASSAAEVATVNDLVDTFKVHPAAVATVLSVFHEVSADDAVALT